MFESCNIHMALDSTSDAVVEPININGLQNRTYPNYKMNPCQRSSPSIDVDLSPDLCNRPSQSSHGEKQTESLADFNVSPNTNSQIVDNESPRCKRRRAHPRRAQECPKFPSNHVHPLLSGLSEPNNFRGSKSKRSGALESTKLSKLSRIFDYYNRISSLYISLIAESCVSSPDCDFSVQPSNRDAVEELDQPDILEHIESQGGLGKAISESCPESSAKEISVRSTTEVTPLKTFKVKEMSIAERSRPRLARADRDFFRKFILQEAMCKAGKLENITARPYYFPEPEPEPAHTTTFRRGLLGRCYPNEARSRYRNWCDISETHSS